LIRPRLRARTPAALTVLALASCAPAPTIRRLDPAFSTQEVCRLEENEMPGRGGLRFDLERVDTATPPPPPEEGSEENQREEPEAETSPAPPAYSVLLDALGALPLAVRPEAPLRLRVGGDSLVLVPVDSTRERRVLHTELEFTRIRYRISLEELRRIAAASEVRVLAEGSAGDVRGRLSAENLAAVRRFLAACTAEQPLRPGPAPADSASSNPGRQQ
jgi:hypothetical protein